MVENPYAVPSASNLLAGGSVPDRVGVEVGRYIPSKDQVQSGAREELPNAVNDPEEEQRDGLRNRLLVHRRTLVMPVWCLSSIRSSALGCRSVGLGHGVRSEQHAPLC